MILRRELRVYCSELVKIKYSPDTSESDQAQSGQLVPFTWNREQEYLHARLQKQMREQERVRALVVKPRQRGCSTYICARFLHRATMREGQHVFILTHEDPATRTLFSMVQRAYDNLPAPWRPQATQDSANSLAFGALGSSYSLGTARTRARGRSANIQCFHGSEVAYWPNADDHADGILQAVPSRGTEIILESTANGPVGWFHRQVVLADEGKSDFQVIFFPWFWGSSLRADPPKGWKPSAEEEDYGATYKLDERQLYWMHRKNLQLLPDGEPEDRICWKFRKEYPATLYDAFAFSGAHSLIRSEDVHLARKRTLPDEDWEPLILGVDVSRGGRDETRIVSRRGRVAGREVDEVVQTDDEMVLADHIALRIREFRPRKVCIDTTSYGWGAYCRLVQMGYGDIVVPVGFGKRATEQDRYRNKRTEIWVRMAAWIKTGVDLPDKDIVTRHLCCVDYQHDLRDRYVLNSKEKIIEEYGFSPDWGDALACTFAELLQVVPTDRRPEWMQALDLEHRAGWQGR